MFFNSSIKCSDCLTITLSPTSPPSRGRGFTSLPPRGGGIEGEGDARWLEVEHIELTHP
jgi:hypothetical protein